MIRGKVTEPDRLKALMTDTDMLHEMRPDILGATLAIEADGTFTETIAFTSEAEARAGEQKEMPGMPAEVRDDPGDGDEGRHLLRPAPPLVRVALAETRQRIRGSGSARPPRW